MPIRIEKLADLQKIVTASEGRPQLIFKHSTRCSISAAAKHRIESDIARLKESMDVHLLDLLLHRDISAAIAQQFGVHHESPQVILVSHGNAVYDTSHYDIEPSAIVRTVEKLTQNATNP